MFPQRNASSQSCSDPVEEGSAVSRWQRLLDSWALGFGRAAGHAGAASAPRPSPTALPEELLPATQWQYFIPPHILSSIANLVQSHFTLHIYFQQLHFITTNLR